MSDEEKSKSIKWISNELTRIMKSEIGDDVVHYLLSMETARDLEEYIRELVDFSSPKAEPFLSKLLAIWQEKKNENYRDGQSNVVKQGIEKEEKQDLLTTPQSSGKNKKTKFSPLFGADGKERTVAKLPGRHRCECLASKHALVNNCLVCGRIVCEQEGSGPCFFCNSLVCTKREEEILLCNTKKSENLRNQLMRKHRVADSTAEEDQQGSDLELSGKPEMGQELRKALEHKNRLLEYDKTSAKRTKVIDDENDYFSTNDNKWLRASEREMLKKKEEELRGQRHASRLAPRKMTFDFAGRRVVEAEVEGYDATEDAAVMAANFGTGHYDNDIRYSGGYGNGAEGHGIKAVFLADPSEGSRPSAAKKKFSESEEDLPSVIQDDGMQMMEDRGMALSMHQPWASLLVEGIKKHEGRSWYTSHRGPLWIASTAQRPDPEEIRSVEFMYRTLYEGQNITFPQDYPTSSLLGRVVVNDCLSQEVYREQYPNGESESPYVFICENPLQLKIKFPIRGKQKIYKLDRDLHKGAKKSLNWNL